MSQSATPATRNEALRRWKARKVTPFAELTTGTAIATPRGLLRTVADGCATSGEHSSTPTLPEWNGNPCYAFGKKRLGSLKEQIQYKTSPAWDQDCQVTIHTFFQLRVVRFRIFVICIPSRDDWDDPQFHCPWSSIQLPLIFSGRSKTNSQIIFLGRVAFIHQPNCLRASQA